ncbi:GIY-YIG nuclease family protein [Pseudomonas sp. AK106]
MSDAEIATAPVPEAVPVKSWFVYLVRAANGSLYCGISNDPQRRFAQHQSGKGARFFSSSPAVALVYVEACRDKGDALRQERLIKKLRKSAKEILVCSGPSGGQLSFTAQ